MKLTARIREALTPGNEADYESLLEDALRELEMPSKCSESARRKGRKEGYASAVADMKFKIKDLES